MAKPWEKYGAKKPWEKYADEKAAPSRFLSGVGAEVLKAGGALADLIPGQENNQLTQWGNEGEKDATGFAGSAGKFVGSTAKYMALPAGGVIKGALGAGVLSGLTTHGNLSERAIQGAETGITTGVMGGLGKAGMAAYDKLAPIISKDKGAAQEIARALMKNDVPKDAPTLITGQDTYLGVPVPKFAHVQGIKPTAGMLTDSPGLLKLEMNARIRNPGGFFQRDNENTAQVYNSIKYGAMPDSLANNLMAALNQKTGPMREDAFKEAAQNPTYRKEFGNYINAKGNEPGVRTTAAMPLVNRGKSALINEVDPLTGVPSSKAMPQDIYAMRKELADKLRLNTLSPDELTNAAKSNRQVTHEIMSKADESLNNASGGKFGDYMAAYQEGIKPVTEGRALQNIIEKFDTKKKIFGTNVPEITPHALRTSVDKETYYNAGNKGFLSNVGDQTRYKLDDAIATMNAMEHAKKGVVAVNGSPTASFGASLAEDAMRKAPGGKLALLAHALGVSRGQRALDDALLNPEKLQPILDIYHKLPSGEAKERFMNNLVKSIQVPIAGAINQ